MMRYPIKLGKEPLVQAAFEVRFQSETDASVLLPGLFYASLGVTAPASRVGPEIPAEVLATFDQNFSYQPRIQLIWNGYTLLIAQKAVAILCPRPYPGWSAFRESILRVAKVVSEQARQITSIERISMRYIDLLSANETMGGAKRLRLNVELADYEPFMRPYSLRIEREEGNTVHVISIAAPATVVTPPQPAQTGTVVDIDSSMAGINIDPTAWALALAPSLNELHQKNKRAFFDCLTQSGLESLDPVYEN